MHKLARSLICAVVPLAFATLAPAALARTAPGGPGAKPDWLPANKQGFGTSTTQASQVWFTLQGGELSEVYYPRIDTPSFRDLQFVVTDGHHFTRPETTTTIQKAVLPDSQSLVVRQVNTDTRHRWQIVKTYTTDPARNTVLMSVTFLSLTGRPYRLYFVADPQLDNNGSQDTATCTGTALLDSDGHMGSAIVTAPAFQQPACGFKGTSDPLLDLERHHHLAHHYSSARNGNVVQAALTPLTGLLGHRRMTLALSFGPSARVARETARASLRTGFSSAVQRYTAGWHAYLAARKPAPSSLVTAAEQREYAVSEMVLAASEDKTFRGAYVASPTMPWAWGTGLQEPSGPYHLVWSRDLYEIATALIADGDVSGAQRALHFLLFRQQKPNGSFPQNSDVTGKPVWTGLQLDEVADPIILAWQLGAMDSATWQHIKAAANFILGWHDAQGHTAPYTPQERWENQAGYSPATIATEIAGLVCAAAIAQHNGDAADAARYLSTADTWRSKLKGWTVTTTGPYGPRYFLRLTKDGDPNAGTTYDIGDSGPSAVDQRRIVDPSFLEVVRLGVFPATDPDVVATLGVVDKELGVSTPTGQFWHRYNFDGYGEQRNGGPWNIGFPPGSQTTIGRIWPIFAGERGEYQLAAGQPAGNRLAAMAGAANAVGLLPEQVWDENPPSGSPGFPPGTPTTSATPLAWSQAQFIRLAWSIVAGHPVEQPSVVACRYVRSCNPG